MKFDKNYDYRNNFEKAVKARLTLNTKQVKTLATAQWLGGLAVKVKGMELFSLGGYMKFRPVNT